MPRKRSYRKKRRKGFVAIPFDVTIDPSTLADSTVFNAAIIAPEEDLFVMSVDAQASLRNGTAGEGPINLGYAHGDLTVTEVSEALNAELLDPDDIIQRERARRPVRRMGTFHAVSTEEVLNNGVPVRTKCKFSVGNGHNFNFWIQNRSGAALSGTARVILTGTIYGRWQR